jgi:hypothetical protein
MYIRINYVNNKTDNITCGELVNLSYNTSPSMKYEKVYDIDELNIVDYILKYGKKLPSYKPRQLIRENNELLLEKSSLTKLGVPREVMQPIQKDLAIPADAEWDKIDLKKDVVRYLKEGDKNLFIQIEVDMIKVIVSYPSIKGTIFFVDTYVYKDDDWSGKFVKLPREFKTITQTIIDIEPRSNIYRLKNDFSISKQSKRKMIKKEKEFFKFSENFKTEFIRKFDSILKRMTGVYFKNAKEKITDKLKQKALENDLLIKGLENPLESPNGLSILDEFLFEFENEYSKFFKERVDIQELCNYFTKDKIMTSFMYFIYKGKILTK